jgi:hypothetical protein
MGKTERTFIGTNEWRKRGGIINANFKGQSVA